MAKTTIHDPDLAWRGYTLFCETFDEPAGEDEPDRSIYLIDMDGEIVHEWPVRTSLQSYCRLLPDGDLIYPTHDRSEVARGTAGLFRIAPDGSILWSCRCRTDHDFQVLAGGNILVHTITESMCPPLGPELKRHPYMVEVAPDKRLVWQWRGEEHLAEIEELLGPERWAHVFDRATGQFAFDWAHNNTLQVIGPNAAFEKEAAAGTPPRFRPGNIVFSYRSSDVIGVIERPGGRIVWAWGPGVLDGQHKPHMLDSGNLLIFDNGTLRGHSRVIELDPLTEEIVWQYAAEVKEDFFSPYISGAQRLPNGNTLICEGGRARLFEVTRDGRIVWQFVNPYRSPAGRPSIYRCLRYSPEYCQPLLRRVNR
jgi:hypothetical protein